MKHVFFQGLSIKKWGQLGAATLLADELSFRQRAKIPTWFQAKAIFFPLTVTVNTLYTLRFHRVQTVRRLDVARTTVDVSLQCAAPFVNRDVRRRYGRLTFIHRSFHTGLGNDLFTCGT